MIGDLWGHSQHFHSKFISTFGLTQLIRIQYILYVHWQLVSANFMAIIRQLCSLRKREIITGRHPSLQAVYNIVSIFLFLWRCSPMKAMASSFMRCCQITHKTHHCRQDSYGRVISSSQRPLPDNTQHSQQKNIHAPGGIRTHDLSRRAAADLRLRLRGHWGRHHYQFYKLLFKIVE